MRVYDMAKEYGFPSKEFAEIMKNMGIPVKNHMSAVSAQQEKYFRNNFNKEDYLKNKENKPVNKTQEQNEEEKPNKEERKNPVDKKTKG